jgi:hypothetical protein
LRELVVVSPFFAINSLPLPIHLYMAGRLDEERLLPGLLPFRKPLRLLIIESVTIPL